jgi:hypothetical protein
MRWSSTTPLGGADVAAEFWVYDNRVHKFAKIHRGDCTFCDEGRGLHRRGAKAVAGGWLGPFKDFPSAERAADATGRSVQICAVCAPSV